MTDVEEMGHNENLEIFKDMQVLTFELGNEVFALEISMVREVMEYTKITKIPKMPRYLLGAISIRGSVVPVIDLSVKFNMPSAERTVNTAIIITELALDEDKLVAGILVDGVKEVIELEKNSISSAPRIGTSLNTDFLKGMAKMDESFAMILDMNKIFSFAELNTLVEQSSRVE